MSRVSHSCVTRVTFPIGHCKLHRGLEHNLTLAQNGVVCQVPKTVTMISVLLLGGHKEALQSSNIKNLLLCPVTRVTANKVCYLTKRLVYGKLLHYKLSIHIASTGISVKIKQRKGNFTLVMHLMCDFCRNVTRVTMEWLTYANQL